MKVFEQEILQGDYVWKTKGKLKMWEYYQKLRIYKFKSVEKLNIKKVYYKVNYEIAYVRYIDDFIIFVWGNKKDCSIIKKSCCFLEIKVWFRFI